MQTRHKLLLSAAFLPASLIATQAAAQSITLDPPPVNQSIDENGVDLSTGEVVVPSSTVAIGGANGLQHSRHRVGNGWRHNLILSISTDDYGNDGELINVQIGGATYRFYKDPWYSSSINSLGTGGSLEQIGDYQTGITYIFHDTNGVAYTFERDLVSNGASYYEAVTHVGTEIRRPDGHITTLTYKSDSYVRNSAGTVNHVVRLASATSNNGYQLKYVYAANTPSVAAVDDWYRLTKVTAINNADEYCSPTADSCSLTGTWPYLSYAESQSGSDTLETVTDVLGRQTRFRTDANDRLTGVKRPSETNDGVVIAYDANSRVSYITQLGSYTRNYSWSGGAGGSGPLTSVSTDSLGRTKTVTAGGGLIGSETDALGNTTSYEYNNRDALTKVTLPEGNSITYQRDTRGRVTQTTQTSKDGSSTITASATYPPLAGNIGMPRCANTVTCDKPTSTTDARGQVTNYTYNQNTGQITDIWAPADSAGIRARRRFAYSNKYAKAKNSSGTLVQFADPIAMLATARQCRTANVCTGSANESLTMFTYDNNLAPNLDVRRVTQRAGDGTLTSYNYFTYDKLGNVLTINGPIGGGDPVDTTTFVYDNAGQQIGTISADPDGSGALPRLASRTTYNADGQVTKTESGTVTGTTTANWNAFAPYQELRTSYDAFGRAKTSAQVQPGTTNQFSITQYSYDNAGRLECSAVRMNATSTSTSLPSSACTPMSAGSFGEDRISKRVYDVADRVTEAWSGVGTSLEQRTGKSTYRANGTVSTLTDAAGNMTTYWVDGFDRTTAILYPHKTNPGTSDVHDREVVTYDAAGNILTHRTRRGETISYNYDNLNRVTRKTVPDRAGFHWIHERDVFYAYDLFGNLERATFDSLNGGGTVNYFDGRGRLTQTLDKVGAWRYLNYTYDAASRRTSIKHPDNQIFTYGYDNIGRHKSIYRAGVDHLLTHGFRPTGQVSQRYHGSPTFRSNFQQDTAGRTNRQDITRYGTSTDLIHSWTFNPANEARTETKNNQLHVWDGHPSSLIDKNYTDNGLNQYDTVGSDSLTYDANGNLTSDGTMLYQYDIENRLVKVNEGGYTTHLYYDPLGRLYQVNSNKPGSGTYYFTYDGNDLIAQYNSGGTMTARYVHGTSSGDDPVVSYNGSSVALSNARFLHRDRLGSVVMSTDVNGGNIETFGYDEYGVHGTNTPESFGYTGQVYIPEIGLYYYKARMYSPSLGRFMQTDPIGYADGPNMYAYVGNNPTNAVDPTGLNGEFNQTCRDWTTTRALGNGDGTVTVYESRGNTCFPDRPFDFGNLFDQYTLADPDLFDFELPKLDFCRFVSHIGSGDRLRFGGDLAIGFQGYFRGGLGLSVDNSGSIWVDGYFGGGVGAAALGALGPSYQVNAPTETQVTLTSQASIGFGPIGGTAQYGTGYETGDFATGGVNVGVPIQPIPTGKFGGELGVTANSELAERIIGPRC